MSIGWITWVQQCIQQSFWQQIQKYCDFVLKLMSFPDLNNEQLSQMKQQSKIAFLQCHQNSIPQSTYIRVRLELFQTFLAVRYGSQNHEDYGFTCDYNVKFLVKRSNPMSQGTVGKASGIIFSYEIYDNVSKQKETQTTQQSQPIKLQFRALENDGSSIQKFARALETRYLVQKGFHDCFRAIKRIGKGISACVYSALSYIEQKQVAVKSFRRSVYFASDHGNGLLAFKKQFRILSELDHPNVCKAKGVFQTENSTYVVLELLSMSLFAFLQKYNFPKERVAKRIMRRLLEGIKYLHDKGIMHRDLKLENIMVRDSDKEDVKPVIVDLGLAEYTSQTKYLYTRCGTPGYVAPEVLSIKTGENKTYTTACDMFSLGIIFHILLLQRSVFQGSDVREVIKKNCECNIDFNSQKFDNIGKSCQHFLKGLLEKDPSKRMTAAQALAHPYLDDFEDPPTEMTIRNVASTETISALQA